MAHALIIVISYYIQCNDLGRFLIRYCCWNLSRAKMQGMYKKVGFQELCHLQ
jgi:hypothetical protein